MILTPPGGWFKFAALIVNVILAMIGAENKNGPRTGPEKRKRVLQVAETQAQNLGLARPESQCELEEIMQTIGELIDNMVRLLNCFGLFSHSP